MDLPDKGVGDVCACVRMCVCLTVCIHVSQTIRFTDPHHWLEYFPPLAKEDLKSLGVRVSPQ